MVWLQPVVSASATRDGTIMDGDDEQPPSQPSSQPTRAAFIPYQLSDEMCTPPTHLVAKPAVLA